MGKLIEETLPLAAIHAAAMRERGGKAGHPSNLQLWWGRSPEASSLAALAAALLEPAAGAEQARQRALLAALAQGDEEALQAVRRMLREKPGMAAKPFSEVLLKL